MMMKSNSYLHFSVNEERVILYTVLGFCAGLMILLLVIIVKIICHHKHRKLSLDLPLPGDAADSEQSRLVATSSTTPYSRNNTINRSSLTDAPESSVADTHAQSEVVEVVRFNTQIPLPNGRGSRTLTHYYT